MTFLWRTRVEPPAPPAFDYAQCETAFLAAGYQVQQVPFLVRKGNKWRSLQEGELGRFVRRYLEDGGRLDLWRADLADDFLAFLKAAS
jgi:hypothetical protein